MYSSAKIGNGSIHGEFSRRYKRVGGVPYYWTLTGRECDAIIVLSGINHRLYNHDE